MANRAGEPKGRFCSRSTAAHSRYTTPAAAMRRIWCSSKSCILAGRIAGEHRAGTYDASWGDLKSREEILTAWLTEMRF